MAVEATPPPATTEDPPPLPENHVEVSKSIFKQARIDAGLDKPDAPPPAAGDEPPPPPAGATPPAKPGVPGDVIEPVKQAITVPEVITEIEAMVLPPNAKKEQVVNFEKLKTKSVTSLREAFGTIDTLKKQVEGATSQAQLTDLQEKLRAAEEKAAGIEERFTKVAFAQSPRFKTMFLDKENAALEGAKSYLQGTDIKPELIEIAANAAPAKRGQILRDAGIDPDIVGQIIPHLATYDGVQREKKSALDNWQTESSNWQAEEQKRRDSQRAQRVEHENRIWDTVASSVDILPLRATKENNPEWMSRRETILTEAKELFCGKGAKPEVIAETMLLGRAYKAQEEVLNAVIEENKNLRAENAGLKSATPGGTITVPGGAPPAPPANQSREERAGATFNAEKAKASAA